MRDVTAVAETLTPGHYAALTLFAILPKCPLCVLAMAGLVGVDGLVIRAAEGPWMQGVGLALLRVLGVSVARRRGIRAAGWVMVGAGALWSLKFWWAANGLAIASALSGAAALTLGSRALRRRARGAASPANQGVAPCHCAGEAASPCLARGQ